MNTEFHILLNKAIERSNNNCVIDEIGKFSWIYPFTTENISGYIDMFDLENKSLLTLGSSGDQVINASLKGCKDQTILDICPFTKFYFYLKKAALLSLDYEEFVRFFCYIDYPKVFKQNNSSFNLESYRKIKKLLKELDKESFVFWDKLFYNCNHLDIRRNLFESDEERLSTLKGMNLYLKDKDVYNKTRISIKNINPKFIIGDIFKVKLEKKYDNIFLSNLGTYLSRENLKCLIDKLDSSLSERGKMLVCYLYMTQIDTEYQDKWDPIYDLDKTFEILGNYITNFKSFIGTYGLKFEDERIKDSVIVYEKKM